MAEQPQVKRAFPFRIISLNAQTFGETLNIGVIGIAPPPQDLETCYFFMHKPGAILPKRILDRIGTIVIPPAARIDDAVDRVFWHYIPPLRNTDKYLSAYHRLLGSKYSNSKIVCVSDVIHEAGGDIFEAGRLIYNREVSEPLYALY